MTKNIDALLREIDDELLGNALVRREHEVPYPTEEADSLLGQTVEVLKGMGMGAMHGTVSQTLDSDHAITPVESLESE